MGLNAQLVVGQIGEWAEAAGGYGWVVYSTAGPARGWPGGLLLLWMTFRREGAARSARGRRRRKRCASAALAQVAAVPPDRRRPGRDRTDAAMLAEAVALAARHRRRAGPDARRRRRRRPVVRPPGRRRRVPPRRAVPARPRRPPPRRPCTPKASPTSARSSASARSHPSWSASPGKEQVDLMVAGGHGHRGLTDLLKGQTIDTLRHGVKVPVLAVKGAKPRVAGRIPNGAAGGFVAVSHDRVRSKTTSAFVARASARISLGHGNTG